MDAKMLEKYCVNVITHMLVDIIDTTDSILQDPVKSPDFGQICPVHGLS